MVRTDVAIVVIGRNEGPRLLRSLASTQGWRSVYVDSGSIDGSAEAARRIGISVIELSAERGFSAARGRNAGIDLLLADPAIRYLQMLDGDSALEPGWIALATDRLDREPELGALFGRLREREPDASIYGWMFDREWDVPAGPAPVFGGSVLLRVEAIRHAGGYQDDMIAGEDPDFALRLRMAGWQIACIDAPMAVHDGDMVRFRQWWRRTMRAGHAFAELVDRHPGSTLHDYGRSRARILFWAGLLPLAAVASLFAAILLDPRAIAGTLLVLALLALNLVRIAVREARRHGMRRGVPFALFLTLGKYAEMVGLLSYWRNRRRRRAPTLIEYKRS
jgi:GT2 family glycosyltransferase